MSKTFLLFLLALLSQSSFAMVKPNQNWKTLTSPNFEVIHTAEQHELAKSYAQTLEAIHHEIKIFYTELPKKTLVIINDQADVTNGYATRLPYPHMVIYPTMPTPNESLADFGNWNKELLAHEYAHLLSFEPAHGIIAPFRYLFGSIISPNLLLPRWWKEGQSVLIETVLSPKGGRLRSPYQNGTLRTLAAEGKLKSFTIDKANEFLDHWPEGNSPYLFGSLLWNQAHSQKGPASVSQLVNGHGKSIPYFLEDTAHAALQKDYVDFYNSALDHTQKKMEQEIEFLKTAPLTPSQVLNPQDKYSYGPRVSPSGQRLAYIAVDENLTRSLVVLEKTDPTKSFLSSKIISTQGDLDEGNPTIPILHINDGPPTGSLQRVEWFKDSTQILFDKIDKNNTYEARSDLYIYNIATRKTKQISKGLRAREPSLSPDEKKIAFVKVDAGKTKLAVLDMASKKHSIHFSSQINERISFPHYLNSEEISFSLRGTNGTEQVFIYNLVQRKVKPLTFTSQNSFFQTVRFFRPVTGGFLFTSADNGIYNTYWANSSMQNIRPLTHSIGGFSNSDLDPMTQDLIGTEMTATGPHLSLVSHENTQKTPQRLPILKETIKEISVDSATTPLTSTLPAATNLSLSSQDYSPYGYMWPRYWLPLIGGSSTGGGWILTAQTSGQDPLAQHSYSLLGLLDTATQKGGFLFSYVNQTTDVPFSISQTLKNSYLGSVNNEISDQTSAIFMSPSLWSLSSNLKLSAGWLYNIRNSLGTQIKRTGPSAILTYGNASQSGLQISPQNGWGSYLSLSHYLDTPGFFSHSQAQLSLQKYFSAKFIAPRHAIMARIDAATIPESIANYHGVSTNAINTGTNSIAPLYLMRGYTSGEFYGRNLITTNLEYRFPLGYPEKGADLLPLFLKRTSGVVLLDGLSSDGRAIHPSGLEILDFSKSFWSLGAETHVQTTVGYVIPLTFILGIYQPLSTHTGNSTNIGFNFLLSEM